MIKIVLRRLLIGLFVMWGAASLIFVIVRVAPGDPATVMLGPDADPSRSPGCTRRSAWTGRCSRST